MSDRKGWQETGFEDWRKAGFESDYVKVDPVAKTTSPAWEFGDLRQQGFLPKGSKAIFLNRNGHDDERAKAADEFGEDEVLTVKSCRIGQFSSTYAFEGRGGRWNTVMFGSSDSD